MPDEHPAPPLPATPAPAPADVASNEELFLHGLHLEQYRHATYDPEPYYQEALRRDPEDSRCNNALGLRRLRQGQFAEAEGYLRRAVARLTRRNPNPYDGEPYYNLGLALRWQGRFEEACDAFYKATWNAAWQDAAFFELARLAARRGDDADALDLLTRCLDRNRRHYGAQMLEAALLRRSGRTPKPAPRLPTGWRARRCTTACTSSNFC
jgi:Flp pilus assembly protein TadD